MALYRCGSSLGGGVPLLSRSEWNTLSMAEKQTYNLVAVQDVNSGFKQGILYKGVDFNYLLYSDSSKILCNANLDNFDATSTTWGGFSRTSAGSCTISSGLVRSVNDTIYYTISNKTKLTLYAVMKSNQGTLTRATGIIMNEPANEGKPCFFVYDNYFGTYDNGNGSTSIPYNELVALAISLDTTTGVAKFFVDGSLIRTSTLTRPNAIQYVFANGTAPGSAMGSSDYRGSFDIGFIGLIDDVETDNVIIANQQNQMGMFDLT